MKDLFDLEKFNSFREQFEELRELLDSDVEEQSFADLKLEIKDLFSPFFSNPHAIDDFLIVALSHNRLQLKFVQQFPWTTHFIQKVLQDHRLALNTDNSLSLKTVTDWMPHIYEGAAFSWSWINNKSDEYLSIDDEILGIFNTVGDLTEAVLKPLLKELVQQTRIIRHKATDMEVIRDMDLGSVVQELIDVTDYGDVFQIGLKNLRISDWRNIAFHRTWTIGEGLITCRYQQGDKEHVIRISKDELLEVASILLLIAISLNLAIRIFLLDNAEAATEEGLKIPEMRMRQEAMISNIMGILSPMEFEILTLDVQDNDVSLIIKNLRDHDRTMDLYWIIELLSIYTKPKTIYVTYIDFKGTPTLRIVVDGKIVEDELKGEIPRGSWLQNAELNPPPKS